MQENNFDDDMELNDPDEVDIYTLTDEDGKESEFELLGRHDENGQSYVALAPLDEDEIDDEEGSFIILKVVEEEGEEVFETIEDDDEFDRIADIFEDEFMQDIDYDEEDDSKSEE
ncbi:MAG: DUF1292 domain-containing protein [Oscillospiraceae bacterium]|nr:DUF1292 domain-containing protein [Oscillospiraceae bacterium]